MKYQIYMDTVGQWRWRLKASNGLIISMSSEAYHNKVDCNHSINLNKSSSASPVEEV